ncbi:MAG: thiamine phosphate synthase [Thiothrix sp.]|nr:MAG: thiamine phosphate synthase [Thiothrix sp.]
MAHELKGLYAITRESKGDTARLIGDVQAALQGGVRILQYRDKSNNPILRKQEARKLLELCRNYSALLIINDDLKLAADIGAHGIHLGKHDADLNTARSQLGRQAIIGISCYNQLTCANKAQQEGANYIAFGSFFPSPTKPAASPAQISLLQNWKNQTTPVCAIGGIRLNRAATLIEAGADMLAIISNLWDSDNIQEQARAYSQLWPRRLSENRRRSEGGPF